MNRTLFWTRREWLAGTVALSSSQKLASALAHETGKEGSYIDAHVHLWTSDQHKYPRSGPDRDAHYEPATFTPEDLFKYSKACGVSRIVLVQMNFFGFDNSYMLDTIAKYESIFCGIAVVDETRPDLRREMRRLLSLGIRGFRIISASRPYSWLDSTHMAVMWQCAAENCQAICTLVDPAGLTALDRMCAKFPDTRVVIDHLARIGMVGQIRDSDVSALCRLARHKHVYVKVSAFYALGDKKYPYLDLADTIRRVYDAYGAPRLMWGSDSPFQEENGNTYAGSIELVRNRLDFFTEDDRSWILRKTAEEVFFKKPSQA